MNDAPIHTVVETKVFTARAKKLGLSTDELASIYDVFATTPDYGKVIRNTGGLRKGRSQRIMEGKAAAIVCSASLPTARTRCFSSGYSTKQTRTR